MKQLTISFSGFKATESGLEANKTLTREQWEDVGHALAKVDARLQWYIGDWLNSCKWEYGELLEICEQFGLNYNTAKQAKSVCNSFELCVRTHNLSFAHYLQVQGRSDADELLDWAEDHDASIKELKAEKKRRTPAIEPPRGKYSLIYADPPWMYTSGDQHTTESQGTVIGSHYQSMTIDAICELPIAEIAADDCLLFLWVTSPLVPESLQVIEAWGFEYKTSMIWDKVKHNVGNYVSVRHELLFICAKGTPPKVTKLIDSVYTEERNGHSSKPEYFRDVLSDLYPKTKKIELFARVKRKGWKAWGDEVCHKSRSVN